MIDIIREAWGWRGIDPVKVVDANLFGNLIVRDVDGAFWRICPEECSCELIANNLDEFAEISRDEDFKIDWEMSQLVKSARRKLGPLSEGQCYCLKLPAIAGGSYGEENLGTISLVELISFAGDMALQIKDLPEGSEIVIDFDDPSNPTTDQQ